MKLRTWGRSIAGIYLAAVGFISTIPGRCSGMAEVPSTLFVAADGRGTLCTEPAPCSLEVAKARVRFLASSMQTDIVVSLSDGLYRLASPLGLTSVDSGNNGHSVIWHAAGQHVVLDGAIRIQNWRVVDRKMNLWSAPVPAETKSLQLFVDGNRAVRARGLGCKSPAQCTYTTTGLKGVDPRLATFRRPQELVAVFAARWRDFHCPVSSSTRTEIMIAQPCWHNTVIDSKNGWSSASPKGRPFKGIEWFENAYELLGTPGQFYLDTHANVIYYVPREGEDLRRADVEMPVAQSLLVMTGTVDAPIHDLTFEGITFAHTTWLSPDTDEGYVSLQAGYLVRGNRESLPDNGEEMVRIATAVTVLGGERISFSRTHFQKLGAGGIALAGGTHNSSVSYSNFYDLSGGAIFIGDIEAYPSDLRLKSADNRIERNTIDYVAREYRDNVGIMGAFNHGLTIDHNTIENLPYTGLSVGWGWNYEGEKATQQSIRITHNKLRNFMLQLYDGGAIYTQAQSPSSEVCANYIDFSGTDHANGIYLDERSRGYAVHDNVIWNISKHRQAEDEHAPDQNRWLSAWSSWSGDLVMTSNWSDDKHLEPHNPGPTKVFSPNSLALSDLPDEAEHVVLNSGADAPEINTGNPCVQDQPIIKGGS